MGEPGRPGWPNRLTATGDWPFVGRAAELTRIERVWADACEGRRQLVVIGGEPGAGKSHLVAAAARHCHRTGGAVTLGLSFAELGVPFQPIAEALGQLLLDPATDLLDDLPGDVTTELVRLVPAIAERRPGATADRDHHHDHHRHHRQQQQQQQHEHGGDDRRRFFDAVVTAFRLASQRWPLVVVLEDLHWAGTPSIQLLAHLVRTTATERLLVIATHRTTAPDRSSQLADTVAELHRFTGITRLDLAGLDRDEIAEFLVATGALGTATARAWATPLARQTGGNPFLLRELWRHAESSGRPTSLVDPDVPLPRSIADTLELRLRSLPAEHVRALERAAVIGDPVDTATLLSAAGCEADTALAALDAGVALGVLRLLSPGETSYAFVHDLARQALLDRIAPARRPALHAEVARAIEAQPPPVHRRSARLAHHWSQARVVDTEGRAVRWLVQAGREAERSLAFEEAMTHYERAAAQLDPDDPQRVEVLLAAAASAVRSGAFADGRRLYELLGDTDDPEVLSRAAVGYEDACWRPGLPGDRAVELLGDAAHRLPPDHELRVPVLAALGRALAFTGRQDQAEAIGEHAIELARASGDDHQLAVALQASLWHAATAESFERQLRRAREGGRLALRLRDWELLAQACTYRGSRAYQVGRLADWHEARQDLERARRASGQPFYAHMALCSDAATAFLHADFATAEAITEELLRLGEAFGQDDTEGVYGLQTFMLRRVTGRLDEVRPFITGEEEPGSTYWGPGLLALYTELGLTDGARRLVGRLLQGDMEAERLASQWAALVAFLADAVCALGDQTAARRLLPYLRRHSGQNLLAGHFVAVFGSADRYVARLLHLLGEHAEAEERFLSALDLDRAMGSVVHEAETLTAYADLLEATDPQAATTTRADAHRLAVRHGMGALARRTAAGPAGGAAPAALPDGLTAREVEVLRLLAQGMSNREVAAALYIAENTAANHVRSILRKTGSANRTRAARYAAERDLL